MHKRNTFHEHLISFFLLIVLILPLSVKAHHTHDTIHENFSSDIQYHETHENCTICSFEFPVFSVNFSPDLPETRVFMQFIVVSAFSSANPSSVKYSFSLRAPPYSTN